MNIKIDYVFPYVNMTDEEWLKEYKEVIGEDISEVRFRDPGTLEILIQLIEKHLPWINNIFLILADKTNKPGFIDKYEKVKIVRHSEFIPKKHLPTYNSGVIESYLHEIPGLSEYFIYGNDDVYPIEDLYPEDFFDFDNNKLKLNIRIVKYNVEKRPHDELRKSDACKILRVKDLMYVPFQDHIMAPYRKSWYKQTFNEYSDVVDQSATRIRDNSRNINQYFFGYWMYIHKLLVPSPIIHKSIIDYKIMDKVFDQRVVCINDGGYYGKDYDDLWIKIKTKLVSKL